MRWLVLLTLLFSPMIQAKEWSDREKQIFTYYSALVAADVAQSMSAMRDPCECFREANPIFGEHISDEEAAIGGLVSMAAMYWMIEKDTPEWFLWSAVAVRGAVVINNHSVGARIDLRF